MASWALMSTGRGMADRWRLSVSLLAVVLCAGPLATAHAQPREPASGGMTGGPAQAPDGSDSAAGAATARAQADPAARERAYGRLIEEGVAEFTRGNFSEARAFFKRAHALKPSARTLRGLGIVAYELQNYAEAETLLDKALRATVHPLTAEQRAQTQQTLEKARALVGRYRLRLRPTQARVLVDGQLVEPRDGRLRLNAGAHRLVVQAEGYVDGELRVDVYGGEDEPLEVHLRRRSELLLPGYGPNAPADAAASAREPDDDGILQSPWFWTGVAALVAGGVTAGLLLSAQQPDPEPIKPKTGVIITTLSEAP